MTPEGLTLLLALLLIAIVCIVMGTGVPTTANYLIMVTVAASILAMPGVEQIVAHFFVFCYGILADITPPIALCAYATAAFPDYLTDRLYMWERWRLAIAADLLVAPEIVTTIIGTAIFLRPFFRRHSGWLPA